MRLHVILVFVGLVHSTGALEMNQTRLLKELFKGYNKHALPRLPGTGPVTVTFDFQLIDILDVSARSQYVTTYAWVNQYWKNDLLKWDPKDYGGNEEIHVSPEDVWVPDILMYNNIDNEKRNGGGRTTYTTTVAVKYDGSNTWLNPAMFKGICGVDVTNFPFDDQECLLKFGSWTSDKFKVDLVAKNIIALNRYYVNNGEWKLLNLSAKRNAQKYQCCPHEFVDITVRIHIQRESLDYILKLIIPCSLISSMIFLGFVLPPESGERIGLSITVLLAMTVFQQLSSELMPSYGFPLLGQFYFAIMLEIGASLAVTTLILNFYHRNRRRMPKTMRKVLLQWLARLLFPCQKPKDWSEIHRKSKVMRRMVTNFKDLEANAELGSGEPATFESAFHGKEKSARRDSHEHKWAMHEAGVVRSGSRGNHSFCDLGVSRKNDCNNNSDLTKNWFKKLKKNGDGQTRDSHHGKKRHSSTKRLNRQLTTDSLPFEGNALDWSEEKFKNQKEWIKAARVLDRLFLIISLIVSVVTLLTIFLRAPRFHLK